MKFCKHCGKEIIEKAEFCKHCGHATEKNKVESHKKSFDLKTQINTYKNFSKKKKVLISTLTGVGLLLIVTFSILNYLSSPQQLTKSIHEAIMEDDYKKISEIVYFEGTDENIGEENAEALVRLIDEEDRLQEIMSHFQAQYNKKTSSNHVMLNLQKNDCFLMMDCYQVTAPSYYMTARSNLNNTEVRYFDKTLSTIEHLDEEVELGPLVYGKYDVESVYENEFVSLQTEQQIYVQHNDQEIDFYFEYDSISIENLEFPFENKIILNGEEMDESIFLTENQIGPVDPEIDYTMKIVTTFPWGDLTTGEHEVTDGYFHANYQPTDDLVEQLATSVNDFYHLLFGAFQDNDLEKIEFLHSELRDTYHSSITGLYEDLKDYDIIHYRDVNEYGIADSVVDIAYDDELEEYILRIYVMEDSAVENQWYTDKIEDPHYEKSYHTFNMHYDEDKWILRNIDFSNWGRDYDYKMYEYDGEAVVIGGDETKEVEQEDSDSTTEVTETTINYINKLVEAINAGDYSIVESFIQSGSSLEGMQKDLVERLSENETTQEVIDSEVTSIEENDGNWKVDTNETIKIMYSSGNEETNDYNWTYTVVEEDGTFRLTDIE